MIDFHSHVLPCMDDGSKDAEESKALLRMLAEQGVTTVAATPHFYANDESVDEFISRRQAAYERLQTACSVPVPRVILGAEVKYYMGISRMPDLKKLCMEGSKVLLLEMPMLRWTEYTIKELIELSCVPDLTIVLAHVERYLRLQSQSTWARLHESGILMQANASFFLDFRTRRKAIGLLRVGFLHFLGSDCHNIVDRPPCLGKAVAYIKKNMGDDYVDRMITYANAVFE